MADKLDAFLQEMNSRYPRFTYKDYEPGRMTAEFSGVELGPDRHIDVEYSIRSMSFSQNGMSVPSSEIFPELFDDHDLMASGDRATGFEQLCNDAKRAKELFSETTNLKDRDAICQAMLGRWQAMTYNSAQNYDALRRVTTGFAFEAIQSRIPDMQEGFLDYVESGAEANAAQYQEGLGYGTREYSNATAEKFAEASKAQIYKFMDLYAQPDIAEYGPRSVLVKSFGRLLSVDANSRLDLDNAPAEYRMPAFEDFGTGYPSIAEVDVSDIELDETMPGMQEFSSALLHGLDVPAQSSRDQMAMVSDVKATRSRSMQDVNAACQDISDSDQRSSGSDYNMK